MVKSFFPSDESDESDDVGVDGRGVGVGVGGDVDVDVDEETVVATEGEDDV